ncbi:MAG: MerR family transcriptional regulator [Acutalibacteraceae bacterium]|nr:MerR family transcriptional regulator [Acutalibacteraceae bacterium]
MHISELAKLTGVSIRTLHYYDEIGLLKPAFVNEQNGYRDYDEKSLERMAEILFYRELDFPLKSILQILSSPDYDKTLAIRRQKELLTLKKQRLERLISVLDNAEKGEISMSVFDKNEYETARRQYAEEAKQRWGGTDAYKESEQKTAGYSDDKWADVNAGLNAVFADFALIKDSETPESEAAQTLVKRLQNYISGNFYTCTKEILAGLGQMYTADERFKANIDKNGKGTADFVSEAIKIYCA